MSDEVKAPVVEVPAVTEVTPPNQYGLAEENSQLKLEIEQLKRDSVTARLESENAASDLRIKALTAAAHKPAAPLKGGQDAIARSKAIAKAGGPAYWYGQSAEARCDALGVMNSASVKDSTLKTYFGSTSSGIEANRLARQSPEEYRRLKQISIERSIL